MDCSNERMNFLDVSLYKKNGKLQTELFCKETDTNQFLHAKSCHRNSYKKSIPYGQAIRIKRICSEEQILEKKLKDLE